MCTHTLLSTYYSIILHSAKNMASQVRETFYFDVGTMFIRQCGHHFGEDYNCYSRAQDQPRQACCVCVQKAGEIVGQILCEIS